MGCVLCTEAAGACHPAASRVKEPPVAAVVAVSAAVRGRKQPVRRGASGSFTAERPRLKPDPYLGNTQQGWPAWLVDAAGDVIHKWTPRRASTFEKLDKIGQGTYSNVYKAKDLITGKIVALKKVRFDTLEPDSVRFMAREILILMRLDHPNVIKLEGLVMSRMSCSLYLVFEYMEHDLAGLVACQGVKFTESQTITRSAQDSYTVARGGGSVNLCIHKIKPLLKYKNP